MVNAIYKFPWAHEQEFICKWIQKVRFDEFQLAIKKLVLYQ